MKTNENIDNELYIVIIIIINYWLGTDQILLQLTNKILGQFVAFI